MCVCVCVTQICAPRKIPDKICKNTSYKIVLLGMPPNDNLTQPTLTTTNHDLPISVLFLSKA